MNAEHFARVRALFAEASELPADQREAFVRAQAGDDAIAAEVFRLLGHDADPQMHTAQAMQVVSDIEAAPLAKGRRVGKYEVFEVLGEGGMGQVYRARRVDGPEHWVALKLMRRGLFSGASESRFLAEQQFLARLNHAGIAHYIDSGTDAEGNVYVAMELVQGQRLREFAKSHGLNAKQRVELFRQLLAAVSYAHRQLIIHRDIKQANVLVTDEGQVKLLDFGIAKLLQDQPEMTGTRERLYTPTCAAPEQIRGELCDVTTDVYALGVLLYELIAGKSIFDTEGKTPGEFEQLVLNVPPPDMRTRLDPEFAVKDIPADLERIVAKAIRKEPNRRYGSVEQFDADLERLLANEPVSVSGNGWLYRAQKFLSRNKLASALSAATALAILIGFAITLQQNREIRAERDRANLALDAMKQAFLGADPGGEAGGEVSAKDILEKSSENLAPLLAAGDRAFLDLAAILLEVQVSMGMMQEAEHAFARLNEAVAKEHPRLCILSARLLAEQRKGQEAYTRLMACKPKSDDEVRLHDLTEARIADRNKEYARAAQLFAALQAKLPVTHPDWVYTVLQQSEELIAVNRQQSAQRVVETALSQAQHELSPNHIALARLQLQAFRVKDALGQHDELVSQAPQLLASLRQKLGDRSLFLGIAHNIVGIAYKRKNDFASAVEHFEQAHAIYSEIRGPRHRDTLRMGANALILRAQMDYPENQINDQFEQLSADSLFPEGLSFNAFIRTEHGRWLTSKSRNGIALMVLLDVDPQAILALAPDSRFRFLDAVSDAYWLNHCSEDSTENYGRGELCRSFPQFDTSCIHARQIICSQEVPSEISVSLNKLHYSGTDKSK